MLMKSLLTSWSRPGLIVLAALIAGTAFSAPFFLHKTTTLDGKVLRTPNTHDMAQHLAVMEQFDNVLKSGVLYPRWLPDINNGYGLPWTNFYPPGLYYLTSFINSALNDSLNTLFVVSALSLAASGLALYGLSRQMYGRLASAVAAVVYVAAPYHILDLYWRGAMPELAGFVLAPLIIYFAFKLGSIGRARYYAGLGFFHGLFVMTHIPVAFLMSYALMLYAVVWAARERDWRIAARITSGIAIAFVLSGIYWLPAFLEIKSASEHFSSIFPYHSSYITLLKGIDRFGDVMNASFAATAAAVLTALAILSWSGRPANEKHSAAIRSARENGETQTRLWIVMGFATTFMCTSLSIYVSKLLPKIDIASFAWRWMVLATLFAALLVGAAVDRLQRVADLAPSRLWAYRAAISAVVVLNIWITTQTVVVGALSNPPLNPPSNLVEAGFSPKGAADPHTLPATPLVTTQPARGASEIVRWDPEHREVHVSLREPSRVRLKTYNFPGWVARVDGGSAPMLSDQDGIQVVEVPEGVHKIEIWFSNTLPRTAGALLSALGLLAVISLAAIDRIREARSADQATSVRRPLIRWLKPVAPVLAPVLVGALILFWLSSRGSSSGETASKAYTSKAAVSATGTPEAQSSTQGTEAVLHLDGVASILVAVDEHALSEAVNAVAANDTEEVDALVQSGRLLRVANDTHVRILEAAGGKTMVRILQGEHLMSEGWVPERWIR
jgi:hypothetical protein